MDLKENYKVIDNYLSIAQFQFAWTATQSTQYHVGELDHDGAEPVGMTANFDPQVFVPYADFDTELFPEAVNGQPKQRTYINYYGPNEGSSFHVDHDDPEAITILYYPCPLHPLNEGGATELLINDEIVGIRSKPNRLLVFKSNILHRATPFKTKPRFTIATKYTIHQKVNLHGNKG